MDFCVIPLGKPRGQNLGHLNKIVYCSFLYKQLLNKEGWASDMFITSTFSVIRSRPLLPNFLCLSDFAKYILKSISWINVILGILVLCDTTIDIIINVGHLPIFHGPVILPYILKVICMNIIICDYESV